MNNFQEKLKELRRETKKTQSDMAVILKVSPRQYQRYEEGSQFPSMEVLLSLADYFKVSIDYLVGRTGELRNAFYHGALPRHSEDKL